MQGENIQPRGGCPPNEGRVPHISLVLREMWDSTVLSHRISIDPIHLAVNIGGIPYLAKNERDMGHPSFVTGVAKCMGARLDS